MLAKQEYALITLQPQQMGLAKSSLPDVLPMEAGA